MLGEKSVKNRFSFDGECKVLFLKNCLRIGASGRSDAGSGTVGWCPLGGDPRRDLSSQDFGHDQHSMEGARCR